MAGWMTQSPQEQAVSWEMPKINRAKTGKGPSNNRGLSEGLKKISGEEVHLPSVAKWTYTHLGMAASPFSHCTTWKVYEVDKDSLWCFHWISEKKFKQQSLAWTKTTDRHVKYPCQILKGTGRPCRRCKSNVLSACFNPGWQTTTQLSVEGLRSQKGARSLQILWDMCLGVVTVLPVHSMYDRSMQMTTKQSTLLQWR